jgi:hypothetical protein
MMLRWVAAVGVFSGVGAALADPVRMTGDDIKHVMQPGAVLSIDTPLRTSIPVTVAPNGLVSGEAGALGLTLGALKDRGRWWTEGDQLCMKWFRWFDAKKRCISLQRDGAKIWWDENSGESGTATVTEAPNAPTVTVASASPPRKLEQRIDMEAIDNSAPVASPQKLGANSPARNFAAAAMTEAYDPEPAAETAPDNTSLAPPSSPAPVAAPKVRVPAPPRRQAKASPAPQRAVSQPAPKSKRVATAPASAVSTSSVALVSFRVSRVDEGDELNVRSGPSEFHAMVGSIPARGRGVQIVGACRDLWCPIRHGRLMGWVNRYYLAEDVVQQTSAKR